MRIITWNMSYWNRKNSNDEAWQYLIDDLKPDIALVQESHPPSNRSLKDNLVWHSIVEKGGNWGSGIYSKEYPLKEIEFKNTYPGALVGAIVNLSNDKRIIAFSLYGLLEKEYGYNNGYATTSVHKMISDLTWILMGHGPFRGYNKNLVIGGDLNISVQCDKQQQDKGLTYYKDAHKIVFDRFTDFGLHSVFNWKGENGVFKQTERHISKPDFPWQNDYLFLSKALHKKMGASDVHYSDKMCKLSDHNPVIVEINI